MLAIAWRFESSFAHHKNLMVFAIGFLFAPFSCFRYHGVTMTDENILQNDKERREEKKAQQAANDRAMARNAGMKSVMKYVGVLIIIVAIIGGIVWASKGSSVKVETPLPSVVNASDWTEGNPDAKVVLVEYSDFQCPTCARFGPVVNRIMEEYGDQVLFVYRYFPLQNIHQNAFDSAHAAEAAGKQGAFFQMANVLFAKQSEWGTLPNPKEAFTSYAQSLGLNTDQFIADYTSPETAARVNADHRSAIAANLSGTPSFFLNGTAIPIPSGYDGMKKVIEAALAKVSQSPASEDTPSTSSGSTTE